MLSSGRDISLVVAIVVGSFLLTARLNRFLSFWWLWFPKGGISSILILVNGFCFLLSLIILTSFFAAPIPSLLCLMSLVPIMT